MAELTLPANSKPTIGKTWKAPAGAKNIKVFKIYRWDPDTGANPRVEVLEVTQFGKDTVFNNPNGSTSLFVVDKEGSMARRVPVQLGRASVSVIEVVKGLNQGDQVILSDTSAWDDRDRLKLN